MNAFTDARSMMADAKFFEGYSRWDDNLNRYESWDESVSRVMNMHREYYKDKMSPELSSLIDEAEEGYKKKYALGAQRALQFGGDQLLKNPMRLYNCTSTYIDRPEVFGEIFHTLLCGAGVGFSVQKHHVKKLPKIQNRTKQAKIYVVEDSIEGWASCLDVLMSSYFVGGGKHPEYEGRRVYFDLTNIRPKGAHISGGFKAPGPEPLRKALDKIEYLIQGLILRGENRLKPIHAYDINMFAADAVLSGGVRRSATICIFSIDDDDMMGAKSSPNWYIEEPQRKRSNNSALILRSTVTLENFIEIMERIKSFGEPGFVFSDSLEYMFNPCVEIGMFPQFDGVSGIQGCNLSEINGGLCFSPEEFFKACRIASILGTLQAGYTNFQFVSETTKKIFERESLIGVSITGWMNNPQVLFDKANLLEGADIVKAVNKEVALLIGINPAARTTCVKPSGNASVLLGTASGIHGEAAPAYIRYVTMNKETEVAQLIKERCPYMVEESVHSSTNSDYAVAFPIVPHPNSIFKDQLKGVNLLEKVKFVQQTWVEEGTNINLCVEPELRHNVSNTIDVPEGGWDDIAKYLFDNREYFAGVSLMSDFGDRAFSQAPNTTVVSEDEIIEKYGAGAMFASGLIVDHSSGFRDLWDAVTVSMSDKDTASQEEIDNRSDWVRRFKKYAINYFEGDMMKAGLCLKDVYILHKWHKIQQNMTDIDFVSELKEKKYTDIDTMGSAACVGGGCELV